jgi:hypothetical protein
MPNNLVILICGINVTTVNWWGVYNVIKFPLLAFATTAMLIAEYTYLIYIGIAQTAKSL